MVAKAPSSDELAAVRALGVLTWWGDRLLELEEALHGQATLNGAQAVLLKHGRRYEKPASSPHAVEW